MNLLLWIVLGVALLLIGKEIGNWLFKGTGKVAAQVGQVTAQVTSIKKSAQSLSIALREVGLKRLPAMLEEFVVGDVSDLLANIRDLAKLVEAGNETILKELDGTFERVLDVKIRTPEGRAVVKAKIDEIEQGLLRAAVIAAPVAEKVAVATALAPK